MTFHRAWVLALACAMPVSAAILPVTIMYGVTPMPFGFVDDRSGLEWRSLLVTRGTTFEQASAPGTFRLATSAEVQTLFLDAGIVGTHGVNSFAVQELLRAWGALSTSGGSGESYFWLADSRDGLHAVGHLSQQATPNGEPVEWIADAGSVFVTGEASLWRGAALVRVVPEPATWLLMLAGLIWTASTRRSHRTHRAWRQNRTRGA